MQWITGRRSSGNTAKDKGWQGRKTGKLSFGPNRRLSAISPSRQRFLAV